MALADRMAKNGEISVLEIETMLAGTPHEEFGRWITADHAKVLNAHDKDHDHSISLDELEECVHDWANGGRDAFQRPVGAVKKGNDKGGGGGRASASVAGGDDDDDDDADEAEILKRGDCIRTGLFVAEFLREAREHRARQQLEHRALEKRNRRQRDRDGLLAMERFAKMNRVQVVLPPIELMKPPAAEGPDEDDHVAVFERAMDAVAKAATAAASELTSSVMGAGDGLARLFRDFDEDDSGTLSHAEFAKALEALGVGLKPAQRASLLGHFDPDNSGQIEYGEFVHAFFNRRKVSHSSVID